MTKLSCSQGFRLCGTNCKELLAIRFLVVALVQAHVDLVQALVSLVQTSSFSGRVDMVGKVTGGSGAMIWVVGSV